MVTIIEVLGKTDFIFDCNTTPVINQHVIKQQ
jgi:hypothetical protein